MNGDKEFVVDKIELTASIGFDTEHYDPEIIKITELTQYIIGLIIMKKE